MIHRTSTTKKSLSIFLIVAFLATSTAQETIEHCEEYYKKPVPPQPTSSSSNSSQTEPEEILTIAQLNNHDNEDPVKTGCKTCTEKYFSGPESQEKINHYLCYQCPKSCQTCEYYSKEGITDFSKSSSCITCLEQYFINPPVVEKEVVQHTCDPCSPGCLQCSAFEKCDKCKISYFTKDDGNCGKCQLNCKECRDKAGCDACDDGYYKEKKSLSNEEDVCKACVSNCLKCYSQHSCDKCKNGYKFSQKKGKCIKSNAAFIMIASFIGLITILIVVVVACCCVSKGKKKKGKGRRRREKDSVDYGSLGISNQDDSYQQQVGGKEEANVGIADRYKGRGLFVRDDDWEEY